MNSIGDRVARTAIVLVGALVAASVGYLAFVRIPGGNLARLFGVVLTVGAAFLGVRFATDTARSLFAPYNVARVSVEGPIARRSGGSVPPRPVVVTADDVVEQIERADEDGSVDGLVVHLDTPGGEVVPSEDIRKAVEAFDGPTVAYATDTCASGGYWIATGTDHIVAREGSIVGSIGVIASRITGDDLLDRLGLTYERLVAGEYKDAGIALRGMNEDEREYLQGIVDDYYETFVDRVEAGRDLDNEAVRDTEARVFLGEAAQERGLVDEIGDEDAVESWLADQLGVPIEIEPFEPTIGLTDRLRMGAERLAYAFGAGITGVLADERDPVSGFRFR
ncbi:MAG: signal peptide peptidase SppA [Halanaeroarchaeum sp.]